MSLPRVRKGSALLVVLGMLSFLIVSAVAFSAYMRSARAPSSFLRRVVSSRLLAQAALAEAIDEVDAAIGNFPHPGVWNSASFSDSANKNTKNGSRFRGKAANSQANVNAWLGRVFVGTNGLNGTSQTTVQKELTNQVDTVPTLTLEGLAYIPPPLVDEARYFSRRSAAGKWHTMKFDAGRYAFCAIDVSDYFDINSLHAGWPRSSDPGSRISLSYLFEDNEHNGPSTVTDWDEWIATYTKNVPLVSMADFNLALNNGGKWISSPFISYLGSDGGKFYGGDADLEKLARATFVTDGWFPPEPKADDELDLMDPADQPFDWIDLIGGKDAGYLGITEYPSKFNTKMVGHLGFPGLVALYDYLDPDKTPTSLALPTTERVPMICGIQPLYDQAQFKLVKNTNPGSQDGKDSYDYGGASPDTVKTRKATRICEYVFDTSSQFFGNAPGLSVMAVYPFRFSDGMEDVFEIDGKLALYFSDVGTEEKSKPVSRGARSNPSKKSVFAYEKTSVPEIRDGVIVLPTGKKSLNTKLQFVDGLNGKDTVEFQDFVWQDTLDVEDTSLATLNNELGKKVLLHVEYEWEQVDKSDPSNNQQPWTVFSNEDPPNLSDFKKGSVRSDFVFYDSKGGRVDVGDDFVKSATKVWLNMAVSVAVKHTQSKIGDSISGGSPVVADPRARLDTVVDLVPANGCSDDLVGTLDPASRQQLCDDTGGSEEPLMLFKLLSLTFDISTLEQCVANGGAVPMSVSPTAVTIDDPRFNYAPESWHKCSNFTKADWASRCGATGENVDGDIFMNVSDQGYLQSVFELANIIRFGDQGLTDTVTKETSNLDKPSAAGRVEFWDENDEDKANVLNHRFMWRTYDPLGRYLKGVGDHFEELKVNSRGVGYQVNPYSDSTNVMMAVFANTPLDWRHASTNRLTNPYVDLPADEFNKYWAWSGYNLNFSSSHKIMWEDLEDVAMGFMSEIRKKSNWEDAWFDLKWGRTDSEAPYCVTDYVPVYEKSYKYAIFNTDKKFLYGYWHDCFAVKQQLFLIFVRAEPMLMGGGDARQAPPQLGVRAVALVWRDPMDRTTESGAKSIGTYPQPHRTRVLFYHQFD